MEFVIEIFLEIYIEHMWGIAPIAVAVALSLVQIIVGLIHYKKHH